MCKYLFEDRDMGKRRRLKEMKNNIANAKEAGFSVAEILGEATEEFNEVEEVQENIEDAWSSIYYPPPYFSGTIYECWSVNMKNFLHARALWKFC